jgi:hypothetical protein
MGEIEPQSHTELWLSVLQAQRNRVVKQRLGKPVNSRLFSSTCIAQAHTHHTTLYNHSHTIGNNNSSNYSQSHVASWHQIAHPMSCDDQRMRSNNPTQAKQCSTTMMMKMKMKTLYQINSKTKVVWFVACYNNNKQVLIAIGMTTVLDR